MPAQQRDALLMAGMGHRTASAENGTNPEGMDMDHSNEVSFPYTFPRPGNYRIRVQVKREERILTGAFDALVK